MRTFSETVATWRIAEGEDEQGEEDEDEDKDGNDQTAEKRSGTHGRRRRATRSGKSPSGSMEG